MRDWERDEQHPLAAAVWGGTSNGNRHWYAQCGRWRMGIGCGELWDRLRAEEQELLHFNLVKSPNQVQSEHKLHLKPIVFSFYLAWQTHNSQVGTEAGLARWLFSETERNGRGRRASASGSQNKPIGVFPNLIQWSFWRLQQPLGHHEYWSP